MIKRKFGQFATIQTNILKSEFMRFSLFFLHSETPWFIYGNEICRNRKKNKLHFSPSTAIYEN